jgi:hypothetical protein
MKYFVKAAFVALFTLPVLSVHADEYAYIDYALGVTAPENTSSMGEYSSLSVSLELDSRSFLLFDSSDYEDTNEYNYSINALGLGTYGNFGSMTDLYGAAQFVRADLGATEEIGFQFVIGLRSNLSEDIELAAKMKYEHIYNATSKSYTLELRKYVTTNFSIGASYETTSINDLEIDTLYGSLRLNF